MKTDAKYVNTSYIADRLDANYYSDKYLVIEQQIKNSGYKVVKYHDICDVIKCGPFGSSVLAENYNDTGIIMIRPLNLKEVLLSEDELVRFPEESLGTDFPVFEAGDILFARVGTPSCSIIPNSIEKVTISPNIIASKLKKTINKYYVALFLNTDYGLNQLERRFKAVSQPTISTDEIKTIDIVLPNVHIQNYIGNKIRKAEELREEAKRLKDEAESLLSLVLKLDEFKYESTKSWVVNAEFLEPYLNVQFYNKEYLSFQKHLKSLGISLFKMSQVLYKIIKNNSPDENDRVEKGIPSLIVSDIDPYRIEIENAKIQVSQDYYKANEHQAICVDDVVYTTAGPPLGEACLVVDEMLPLLSGAHVAVLSVN
ncbi:restriction endonuclease subunit S [Geobacillus sp. FSL W8-0466]|uniref:restriction endonuclease subunit S n=1 Tax=Geobacillus sp. FSL W8-0466 TaxID=2975350 RepID=UPI0030DD4A2D